MFRVRSLSGMENIVFHDSDSMQIWSRMLQCSVHDHISWSRRLAAGASRALGGWQSFGMDRQSTRRPQPIGSSCVSVCFCMLAFTVAMDLESTSMGWHGYILAYIGA